MIEVLRPYGGDFRVEDQTADSYSLSGKGTYFYVAYWSPRLYREQDAPPALGALRSRPLHHWDLHAGGGRKDIASELATRVVRRRSRSPVAAAASRSTSSDSPSAADPSSATADHLSDTLQGWCQAHQYSVACGCHLMG